MVIARFDRASLRKECTSLRRVVGDIHRDGWPELSICSRTVLNGRRDFGNIVSLDFENDAMTLKTPPAFRILSRVNIK